MVRRGLDTLAGRQVVHADAVSHPRFAPGALIESTTLLSANRKGKWLSVQLGDGRHLQLHLGMTGQLTLSPPATPATRPRCRWELDDGRVLQLADPRGFGQVRIVEHHPFAGVELGAEPGQDGFVEHFSKLAHGRGAPAFAVLIDQDVAAGVGAYVAQEALWRAGVHPGRRGISLRVAIQLAEMLEDVVADALAAGGMSVRDYVHIDGTQGAMSSQLQCYGRAGQPCSRCGSTMVKLRVAGRGCTRCPRCQRR